MSHTLKATAGNLAVDTSKLASSVLSQVSVQLSLFFSQLVLQTTLIQETEQV